MNEAGLLLYAASLLASVSLGLHGLKNRYLPVARPLAGLAFILAVFCLINFLELLGIENRQWLAQFVSDFRFMLISWVIPLSIWMITEYQLEKKIKSIDIRVLIFSIQPVVIFLLLVSDIFFNGFLSRDPATALIQPEQRIGGYHVFRQIYGVVIMVLVITTTLYLMIKKQ